MSRERVVQIHPDYILKITFITAVFYHVKALHKILNYAKATVVAKRYLKALLSAFVSWDMRCVDAKNGLVNSAIYRRPPLLPGESIPFKPSSQAFKQGQEVSSTGFFAHEYNIKDRTFGIPREDIVRANLLP